MKAEITNRLGFANRSPVFLLSFRTCPDHSMLSSPGPVRAQQRSDPVKKYPPPLQSLSAVVCCCVPRKPVSLV